MTGGELESVCEIGEIDVDGVRVVKVSGVVGHAHVDAVRDAVRRRPFEQPLVADFSGATVLEPAIAEEISRELYWRSQSAHVGMVATGVTRRRFDDTLLAATASMGPDLGALLDTVGRRSRRTTATASGEHVEPRPHDAFDRIEDADDSLHHLRVVAADVRRSRVLIVVDERRCEWVHDDAASASLRAVAGLDGVEAAVVSHRRLAELMGLTRLTGVVHLLGGEEWEATEPLPIDERVVARIRQLRTQIGADASITLHLPERSAGSGVTLTVERSAGDAPPGRAGTDPLDARARVTIDAPAEQVLDLLLELRLAG